MPERVQLKRTKGYRMPPNTRKVDRSTRWGNPFVANDWRASFRAVLMGYRGDKAGRHAAAVRLFELWMTCDWQRVDKDERGFWQKEVMTVSPDREKPSVEDIKRELGGKNLACWCPLNKPCHADVLLRLANE